MQLINLIVVLSTLSVVSAESMQKRLMKNFQEKANAELTKRGVKKISMNKLHLKKRAEKSLRATSGDFVTTEYCGALLAQIGMNVKSGIIANTCLEVEDSGDGINSAEYEFNQALTTVTEKLHTSTDCSDGSPSETESPTGECIFDAYLVNVVEDSTAYSSPSSGFSTAVYEANDCSGAPLGYQNMMFAVGTCLPDDDDSGSMLTKQGCSTDRYASADCTGDVTGTEAFPSTCGTGSENDDIGSDFMSVFYSGGSDMGYCGLPLPADDDAVCFSGSEQLVLENGSTISMEDAKIGDKVQVATAAGSIEFADVVFIPHDKNTQASSFVELETATSSLKVTPAHLVMTCDKSLVRAESVAVGACLATVAGEETVTAATTSHGHGVYSVITSHADGIIIVNGFKASSFAMNHAVTNAYYNIHRALYAVAPGMVAGLTGLGAFLGKVAGAAYSA